MSSASYFSSPIDRDIVLRRLQEYAENCHGAHRVRLLASAAGDVRVTGQPLAETALPAAVAFAEQPIDRNDRFLYHKTTHRAMYDIHRQIQPNLFDVLLWNEAREVTEFTTGNVVFEIDGKKWTPPIACGLLPGTLRAELLERGEISERAITVSEIERADAVWFINSVRGWDPGDSGQSRLILGTINAMSTVFWDWAAISAIASRICGVRAAL